MKKMNVFQALLIPALLIGSTLRAQDAKTLIRKIGDTYSAASSIQFELEYKYYRDIKDTKPLETQTSSVKIRKNQYAVVTGTSHTLQNDKYLVVVDHSRKLVMVDKALPQKKSPATPFPVDSLLSRYQAVELTSTTDGYQVLTLKMKPGNRDGISGVVIRVRNGSALIEQVTVYYGETEDGSQKVKPWMNITYRNTLLNNPIDNKYFSEGSFLTTGKAGLELLPAYKKYNLISHL